MRGPFFLGLPRAGEAGSTRTAPPHRIDGPRRPGFAFAARHARAASGPTQPWRTRRLIHPCTPANPGRNLDARRPRWFDARPPRTMRRRDGTGSGLGRAGQRTSAAGGGSAGGQCGRGRAASRVSTSPSGRAASRSRPTGAEANRDDRGRGVDPAFPRTVIPTSGGTPWPQATRDGCWRATAPPGGCGRSTPPGVQLASISPSARIRRRARLSGLVSGAR